MQKIASQKLTARYAPVQAFYWASFNAIYAFASVYLLQRGFNNTQIGVLLAAANSAAVLLQPLLATLADKHPSLTARRLAIALILLSVPPAAGLLAFKTGATGTAVLFCLTLVCILTLQPFINAMGTSLDTATAAANFGTARAFGSLGYGLVSVLLGVWADASGAGAIVLCFLLLAAGMLGVCIGFCPVKSNSPRTAKSAEGPPESAGIVQFACAHKKFMVLLAGFALVFVCYNMSVTYIAQIVAWVGGNIEDFGAAIALAAFLEIPTMVLFSVIVRRFNAGALLKFSCIFFLGKVLCYLFAGGMGFIYLGQFMNPLSFALFIPASVYYVNQLLPPCHRVKGHAFMTVANTAGGVGGTLLGGRLIDTFGITVMLAVATGFTVAGGLLVFWGAQNPQTASQGS